MKFYLLFYFLIIPFFGYCQITSAELKTISKNLKDPKSLYFNDRLIFKFKMMPKSLDSIEAKHLYYGRNFIPNKVFTNDEDFIKLADAFQEGKFEQCTVLGKAIYAKDPTNLDVILILLRSYDYLKDANNFAHYITQLRLLTNAIKESGDGKTEKTAFVVNSVDDEYIFLNILNVGKDFIRKSKAIKEGMIDIWEKDDTKIYIKTIYLK